MSHTTSTSFYTSSSQADLIEVGMNRVNAGADASSM